jgi:hypothetical protein
MTWNQSKLLVEVLKTIFCLAAFHHYNSTRDNPNHDYCDPSKCHFYKFKYFDHNKQHLAPAVMKAILPVYEKMCSDSMLSKVVDGGTTNSNESFHSYIWSLCPKTQFHSDQYVRTATSLACILYNDDYLSIVKILEQCGITSAIPACHRMLKLTDNQRQKEQSFKTADARQKQRQGQLLIEQHLNDEEIYNYARRAFD